MLSIDSVQARHAGRYSCRAKNHAAAVNYTTELIVNGIAVHQYQNYSVQFWFFIFFFTLSPTRPKTVYSI